MIKSVPAFVTPEDMKDLEDRIESYSGSEKAAAWMGAIMAWNLACKMVNEKEVTEDHAFSEAGLDINEKEPAPASSSDEEAEN